MRQKKLKHLQWLCRQYFSGEVHLDLGGLNVRLKQECSLFWRETFSSSSILQWLHVAFNWSVYRRFRRAILIANRIRCAAACHLDMCCRVRPGDTHRSPKAQCTSEFCGAWFYIRYNRTASAVVARVPAYQARFRDVCESEQLVQICDTWISCFSWTLFTPWATWSIYG